MPTAILDLDDTLLNTNALKNALASSLDLTREQWEEVYRAYVEDNGKFDQEGFLRGVDPDQRTAFDAVLRKMTTYLYKDSMIFIKRLLDDGWRVVILTYGDAEWQQTKVDHLRFPNAVETRVTSEDKTLLLDQYIDPTRTILIDDRADVIDTAKKLYPELYTYWMRRPDGAHRTPESQLCDTILDDLNINI